MDEKSGRTVVFRMNGVAAGFLREYGCHACPQCDASKPQTHISASLLIKSQGFRGKPLQTHLLFDCGLGVIDSLIEFGAPPVDLLFISHGHPYHSLGLDRLLWGQLSHFGRDELPLYCTRDTQVTGPERIYPWFFGQNPPRLVPAPVTPLVTSELGLGIDLKITPVPVFQGASAPGAVIWVIEFGQRETGTYRKLVLGWEFVHFVPRHPDEDQGVGYVGPHTDALDLNTTFGHLFKDVDELIFDGNTVTPRPETNHMSIQAALRFLIPKVRPQRTWIAHYSGHEDLGGPMSDEQLQDWVNQEKPRYGLAASDIRIAQQGMLLAYSV